MTNAITLSAAPIGFRTLLGAVGPLLMLLLALPFALHAQGATAVKMARLQDIAIYPWKLAPATVVSLNEAALAAQIKARIDEITVRVGDIVAPGAPLVRLDCTDYRLAQQQAEARLGALEASLALAQRRLERARKLERDQTVSAALLDERETELSVLQADRRGAQVGLDKATLDVSRCVLKSPYRAVVTRRIISVGEFADMGTRLLELLDLEQLEVSAQVTAEDISQVIAASELYFQDASGSYKLRLRVVSPAVTTQTRNQEVRLLFSETAARPGSAGKLTWRSGQPHLPAKLLVQRGNERGFFIDDSGSARFHAVPGAQQGRTTPVTLPLETVIITEGHYGLEDGQAIMPYNPR